MIRYVFKELGVLKVAFDEHFGQLHLVAPGHRIFHLNDTC